jgi:hypothetical protein
LARISKLKGNMLNYKNEHMSKVLRLLDIAL